MIGKNPLIVILGPTAAGKTDAAIAIAQTLNGEIISADSRQIYRYMDIGTAKPTPEQSAAVPHYLIDVVDPDDNLSVSQYQQMAYATIHEVHSRGRIPLLVGGTGQYITAVTEGWSIPEVPPNEELRTELEAFAASEGADTLYERLLQLDPEAAAKIHPHNIRRVIRALEVYEETGQPISLLQRKIPPPYAILELGLTLERQRLYERADRRVDIMIQRGFIDEVQKLLDMGYDRSLPSMSGLGYRELCAYLAGEISLEIAVQETKSATHRFIRRQYTWFQGHNNGIVWHSVEQEDVDALISLCTQWLETYALF